MAAEIDTLIDKFDNVEAIRDQIAAILVLETANQIVLATTAGKPNPQEWNLKIYKERFMPFEKFLNSPTEDEKLIPIVNVWFDSEAFEKGGSNIMERQRVTATYNIDIYGYGEAEDDGNGGFTAGDENAALNSQRGTRLVRNILMSSLYTNLKLLGLVGLRWVQSITQFQPELEGNALQKIVANRIAFEVLFNEFAPQYTPVELEFLSVDIKQASDGMLIAEADFDYT